MSTDLNCCGDDLFGGVVHAVGGDDADARFSKYAKVYLTVFVAFAVFRHTNDA